MGPSTGRAGDSAAGEGDFPGARASAGASGSAGADGSGDPGDPLGTGDKGTSTAPDDAPDGDSPMARGDRLSAVLATSLAARPVLCDLTSAQAGVLERNVSPQVALAYKRATVENAHVLAGLVRQCVPELDEYDALRFAGVVMLTAGSVWTHAHPSEAMLSAYEADPALAALRLDFTDTLRQALEVFMAGLLARRGTRGETLAPGAAGAAGGVLA
ncbi:hypothetical protein [Streptomyces sp. TS71-3]|uniref:hypothetical protein n=1 Tax=Streptomyces sp. TS71-3 TaxID=2733862 RepID=UPI0035AB768F